ncbi:gliding motility-associated C-terminal domain [Capnocytophaga ochracea]|uniref:Gliding motility-associated C-terminal domain n=2 Tax=Capnocytophaga ochracea TaxID=1018 RepID=A0A7Z9CB79_CAPOC|nr:gliding motility-associated C-terminal domain [Capnocytophaga ochracea]
MSFYKTRMKNITKILLAIAFFLISFEGVEAQVQSCNSMPEPVAYTRVGTPTEKRVEETAVVRGITVTRILEVRGSAGDKIMYSNQETIPGDTHSDETYCGKSRKNTFGGKKYPFMDSNKVSKITYKFSKPVIDAEVFLAAFGYSGTRKPGWGSYPHIDVVKITTNKGTATLHARSTCGENNLVTVSGNEISSINHKTTDAKIGITSTEPFTELVLQVIEKKNQTGGYGFFVEICLASIIADASCEKMPNAQFGREQDATATMGGVKVTRSYTGKGNFSNAGEPRGPIYCQSSYSGDLPWVLNSNNNINTLTYTFEEPVTEAELWFVGMGGGNGISAYDRAKVSVNCDNITLREAFRCNGNDVNVTNPSANSRLISVKNPTKVTDIAYKVTSSKPFTKITIEDSSDAQAAGYLVEMCPTSVKKANIITVNTALTEQTVCDNTGNAPSYLAKATITPAYAGGTLNYELQAKKKGSTTWETITTNNSVTNDLTYQPSALKALAYNEATVRIKYTYSNSAKFCGALTKYSNEVKLNVNASTTITTQPATSVAYCKDATPTALTVTATGQGTLSYQWYSNTTNNNTGGTLITGANTATYTPPTTTAGSTYYYVAVTGTCGTVTSTVARVQVLTASDVITINTPNYNNINGICNTNSTISAQATIAPDYSNKIKNLGGGNFFAYQLEYRKTPTSPWENYYDQVYSNNGNGWTRTFSINPNNTPSGATFRVRYTADIVNLCNNLTVYSNEFTYTKQAVTTITTQPVTPTTPICKDATATVLNVVATGEGTLAYQWYSNTTNNNTGGSLITGANVATYTPPTTATGTTYYYAVVTGSCGVATSTVAKVDVLTPPEVTQIIATPPAFKQGESASVVFTIKGTPNAQVTYNINGTGTQVVTLNSSGTYTLPSRTVNQTTILNVTKVKLGACEQNYTDKSGGILATTAKCTTKPAPQFPTSSPDGRTAVMNGLTVTRTYSKTLTTTTLVYGTIDNDGYCSGTPYHNYTIIHTHKNYSPRVTYTFSQPVTSAEVWLMIMGSPSTVNDKVRLSTNNGTPTFTKVYDCAEGKGQAGATLSNGIVTSQDRIITDVAVRVTSNTPFTELIVEDINGTNSSGVLVELCPASITPAETISITTQPQSQTICADKMATFTSKAQLKDATGNIQYKWQQKSDNGTNWTDIPASTGSIASGGTASLTIAGTTNYKYRVVYSYQFAQGIVVTATSQEATLTKLPSVALPTLITGSKTLCPTATSNVVSFANYVTVPTGTTLLWYTAPTATVSSTTAPVINTHVTTRTTQTAYVRALSTAGCTSGIVTVTLTVDDTTAPTFTAPTPLNIVCNSTTATTAINNWISTATATDACGAIATITNNYNAPADLCTVPGGIITVTFVAKDTFGNTKTGTSTIHLGVTPLVVKDDTFNIPDGLATQTTTSVLANDSLGGNTPTAGNGGTVTITNVVPATPINGGNVPVLNPDNGVVTIPANTPAGTYTITYKECEALNPNSNCQTATAVIKVGTPTITVVPDPMTVTPSTTTQTIPSILNNDKIGGTVTPTAGPGGNVTMTVNNPSNPGNKPTLDPNTGKVTIPGNTPAGTYTITYNYCEVLNPTNCTGTQTLVVTVGAATLTVVDDTFNIPDGLTTQTTISVLDNDSLGGNTPTAGNGGTVTITNVVPATPINGGNVPVLNPENGVVTIPANTPAGTYTITYKECEALNPNSNCQTATAVIKVGTPTITVVPDPMTVTPSTTTQTIPSILNNDKIGGTVTPTAGPGGNVTMTVTNPSNPGNKPTLDPNTGKVTIPGNTPAGTYTITYSYCEVLNPTNCTGTQTLVVTVGAATLTVVDDTFNIPDGLTTQTTISVLDNDSLGGNTPTAGNGGTVTITNVVPATPINGGNVPVLNPDNGVVTIPANTPAGTYTITYKECEALNPNSNCKTATAVIKVGTPTITVVPDPMTVTPSTTTQTIPSILNNDKIGGTVTPTAGPGGNVTMTVNNPSNPGNKPTLDPNTGEVTIPGNTPAGTYTITYSYCEVLNPTNCTGTQTLVVTVGAATLTVVDDTFNIPDGLTTQTTISVLDNDSLGGNTPTAGNGGTVTITNVVPATPINGGNVPVLNPENGVVTIPANTPAGTYTITYKECEALNPNSNCKTATAVIKVGTPTITVVPDPMTVTPSTTTQTIPSILNNDKIGGTVTPTAGPGGNVTMTVNNPSNPGNKPTLDPNTGEVTIPGNTPAGTYTITYSYCEVLNPTNCTGTQTLVVTVVGTATPTPTPVAVDDRVSTALNTPVNIAVLPNDTLNGATTPNVVTQPANGTVVVNADNTVEYRPHTGFVGTDTFVYEICNSAGCSSATVTVDIVNKLIPYNGMSVNGDGKNDHFHIGGIENYPNNVVRIYNRWGVKVFEVSGYDNVTRVFRGISDGRVTVEAADKLPQGTYYYVIEYYDQNNNKQSEVGWLYIKK